MIPLYEVKLLEAESISRAWKSFHIILLVFGGIFGICGGIILSFLYDEEDFLCATPIILKSIEPIPGKHQAAYNNSYIILDFLASGVSDGNCEYTLYTLITSFIFASIWTVFFMMCGRGGRSRDGLPKPWRIVVPASVFSTIFLFTSLGACVQLTVAIDKFCYYFDDSIAERTNKTITEKCEDLHMFMSIRQMQFLKIQSIMKLAEVIAWLCMTSWFLSAALCIFRVIYGPDFDPVLHPVADAALNPDSGYKVLSNTPTISRSTTKDKPELKIVPSTSVVEVHSAPSETNDSLSADDVNVSVQSSLNKSEQSITPEKKVQFDAVGVGRENKT